MKRLLSVMIKDFCQTGFENPSPNTVFLYHIFEESNYYIIDLLIKEIILITYHYYSYYERV